MYKSKQGPFLDLHLRDAVYKYHHHNHDQKYLAFCISSSKFDLKMSEEAQVHILESETHVRCLSFGPSSYDALFEKRSCPFLLVDNIDVTM